MNVAPVRASLYGELHTLRVTMNKVQTFFVLAVSMALSTCGAQNYGFETRHGPMNFCTASITADTRENVGEQSGPPPDEHLYLLCNNGKEFRIHESAVEPLTPVGNERAKNP